ncbi:MAG: rhodanese-like domain-containing protein [Pirellulaceae bacterium]
MSRSSSAVVVALLVSCVVAGTWARRGLAQAAKPEHTRDSVEVVKKNLADGKAVLLDVREESEWRAGRLEQARLFPLSKLRGAANPKSVTKELDATKIIYCHCRSGGRVLAAAEILRAEGFDVRPLKQGYEDLLKSGFTKAAASAE